MKTKKRRIPAVFLLTALILAAFPVTAFAAETAEVKIPVKVERSGETPAQKETYIVKLEAHNQAPMPAQDTVKVTGTGMAEFPAITIPPRASTATKSASRPAATKGVIMTRRFIM